MQTFSYQNGSFKFLKPIKYGLCFCLILAGINTAKSEGGKHVYINKSNQTLTAYEGGRRVFSSPVSTGKSSSPTPSGSYTANNKELMHISRLYDNTPMPHSVQIGGHYFIHGGPLPGYPASHGCVRLPYGNAQKLFNWINIGTPVTIGGSQESSRSFSNKQGRKKRSREIKAEDVYEHVHTHEHEEAEAYPSSFE